MFQAFAGGREWNDHSNCLLGEKLWACVEKLDQGWDIGLYGGDSSHVGAVTLADEDGIQTM